MSGYIYWHNMHDTYVFLSIHHYSFYVLFSFKRFVLQRAQMVAHAVLQIHVHVRLHIVAQDAPYVCLRGFFNRLFKLYVLAVCSSACQNGGTCSAPNTCTCTASYSGTTCTIRKLTSFFIVNYAILLYLAVCSPTCSNGGTCSSPGTCTCPSTYSGTRCTIRKIRHYISKTY